MSLSGKYFLFNTWWLSFTCNCAVNLANSATSSAVCPLVCSIHGSWHDFLSCRCRLQGHTALIIVQREREPIGFQWGMPVSRDCVIGLPRGKHSLILPRHLNQTQVYQLFYCWWEFTGECYCHWITHLFSPTCSHICYAPVHLWSPNVSTLRTRSWRRFCRIHVLYKIVICTRCASNIIHTGDTDECR